MKDLFLSVNKWKVVGTMILLLGVKASITAQVITRAITADVSREVRLKPTVALDKMPTLQLEAFDIQAELRQDSLDNLRGLPFKFGKSINVNADVLANGLTRFSSDTAITNYFIYSKGAKSINLIFDQFKLTKGAEMIIYNSDKTVVYGPVTAANNPRDGIFWTDVIPGSGVVIQVSTPKISQGENTLHLAKVTHGYNNAYAGFGESASCHRNIACGEGDQWRNEGNAVAMILLGDGTRWCTGTLINNACQDFRPFFLTAFHCLDVNTVDGTLNAGEMGAVTSWVFRFKYDSPQCFNSEPINWVTMNGSNFRAAHVNSDFALIELSSRPPEVLGIPYAGWSRSTTAATSAVSIHHPNGDVKKISVDNDPLTNVSITTTWHTSPLITCPANTHWASVFETGTVEHGSSGAPIFDQDHRVVGQLHGDYLNTNNDYCGNHRGQYGRFDVSWTGGGTNDTRLSNWLDPNNTGLTTIDRIIIYPSVSGPSLLCSNGTFTLNNYPPGAAVSWAVAPVSAVVTAYGTGATANLTYNSPQGQDLRIYFSVGCSPGATFIYDFHGGAPSYVMSIDGVNTNSASVSPGSYHSLNAATISPGSASYNYTDYSGSGDMSISLSPSGSYAYVYVNSSSTSGHREVMVAGTNACGTLNQSVYLYLSGMFRMYPNPARSDLTLEFSNAQVKESLPAEISLLAEQSTEPVVKILVGEYFDKKQFKDGNKIPLDVSQLRRGTYYLHVKYNETQEKHTERIRVVLE